jgi:hypothetical protein
MQWLGMLPGPAADTASTAAPSVRAAVILTPVIVTARRRVIVISGKWCA